MPRFNLNTLESSLSKEGRIPETMLLNTNTGVRERSNGTG